MVAGLADELTSTGVGKLLEHVKNIRGPQLELFETDAGYRKGDSESTLVSFDKVENLLGGWSIALVRNLEHDLAVCVIVEVEGIVVEHRVPTKTERLVNLKIEADRCHGGRGYRQCSGLRSQIGN